MALRRRDAQHPVAGGRSNLSGYRLLYRMVCVGVYLDWIRFYRPAARRDCELHQLGCDCLRIVPVLHSEVERLAARLDEDPSRISLPGSARYAEQCGLGELLVANGYLDQPDLDHALRSMERSTTWRASGGDRTPGRGLALRSIEPAAGASAEPHRSPRREASRCALVTGQSAHGTN